MAMICIKERDDTLSKEFHLLDTNGSDNKASTQFEDILIYWGWLTLFSYAVTLYSLQSLSNATTYSSASDIKTAQKKFLSTFEILLIHSSGIWASKFANRLAYG